MKLDALDLSILKLLQKNSKLTNKALSTHLSLSVTAVYERIKKLEKTGIIKGYVALLSKEKLDQSFVAFCHVKLIQHTQDNVKQFEKEVIKIDEVLECYHLSGDYDYLLKVHVKDMESYRNFMIEKLTNLNHIGSTHSMFMINEVKHTTALNI
ncbi:MAG: Lrp/AsnC family transcriptional regulator [Flavobacteriaceae bacterium]|jgi:Lrp/AsnC family leucine-responsive transcriptional regulator|tara:strand:- start:654 stop:1112 length:459 start_codon:yes stop_codon:yes gene_type:complete